MDIFRSYFEPCFGFEPFGFEPFGFEPFGFEPCFKGYENGYKKKHREKFKECLYSIQTRGERLCRVCFLMGKEYQSVGNAVYWTLSSFSSNNQAMDVARAYVLCLEHTDKSFHIVKNCMALGSVEILDRIYNEGCEYPCMLEF